MQKRNTAKAGLAGILFTLAFTPYAAAFTSGSEVMAACRADYIRHCAGVMPGGGRILNCLGAKMPELNPPCREAVIMGSACLPDYQRFCPDARPGAEVMACMKKNAQLLSVECGKVISAVQPAR